MRGAESTPRGKIGNQNVENQIRNLGYDVVSV